jgi:hypothetical protein
VSNLDAQTKFWGRDGHGIPGVNPNYAGRVGLIAAAAVFVLAGGAFAILSGGPARSKAATRYTADVAKDISIQPQFDQSLHTSATTSSHLVHELIDTLVIEDRRLSTQHWPVSVAIEIKSVVSANQRQISVLQKYEPSSPSERATLLKQQNDAAYTAEFWDARIRTALGAAANPLDN